MDLQKYIIIASSIGILSGPVSFYKPEIYENVERLMSFMYLSNQRLYLIHGYPRFRNDEVQVNMTKIRDIINILKIKQMWFLIIHCWKSCNDFCFKKIWIFYTSAVYRANRAFVSFYKFYYNLSFFNFQNPLFLRHYRLDWPRDTNEIFKWMRGYYYGHTPGLTGVHNNISTPATTNPAHSYQ